ncbi:hypothetical protein [Granulicella sp. WH15]|uniref:hypothetical protein n=1 Tax=Granulicella sp. WH15 TaxID=2602070 RepID=UPI0021046DC3|nr:hypothetical protein [Granulicella sp. WH15]
MDREGSLSGPEWQLACRVAASKGFCKSEFLPRFLLYVCEQYLTGDTQEITEQRIGTQIFNRSTGYNPGEDNIVRSYARLLRKRLDEYFDGEGRDEPMRIVIPRGGYIPTFYSSPDPQQGAAGTHPPENGEKDRTSARPHAIAVPPVSSYGALTTAKPWRPAWLSTLLGMVIGGVLATAGWLGIRSMQAQQDQSAAHAVWAQMFQRNRNTLIVPADSGLGILENLSGHLVSLEEYANGAYPAELHAPPGMDPGNLNDLRRQHYTSVVDLDITSMLTRLPEFIANRTQVRYARGITAEDIKNSNSILLGSAHTNPWVSLFEKRLNFRLEYTPQVDQSFVVNLHPIDSEQAIYRNGTNEKPNRTYGTIAYLPEGDGAGHVLIIQGLNMAATQAAADTLFNAKAIKPILQQATLPNGSLKPFELLVETNSIGATAPEAQIIATRFYVQ